MRGGLKKRGLDRDTISIDKAIGEINGALRGIRTNIDDNNSFDYEIVEFTAVEPADNPHVATVARSRTEAVISYTDDMNRIHYWEIAGGELRFSAIDGPVSVRFVVF